MFIKNLNPICKHVFLYNFYVLSNSLNKMRTRSFIQKLFGENEIA